MRIRQIYRRAIMRQLDPRDRADAWRAVLRRYLNTEHELTRDQVRVVQDAMELLSEETFTPPVAADSRCASAPCSTRPSPCWGRPLPASSS